MPTDRIRRSPGRAAAAAVACAALVAAAGAACDPATQDVGDASSEHPAAVQSTAAASPDPGCASALNAVSTYGPKIVTTVDQARKALDKAEVTLIVDALDAAADLAGAPQDKQAIRTLANAYLDFSDALDRVETAPLTTVLADVKDLDVLCGS